MAPISYTVCTRCGCRMPDDYLGCPPNYCPSCALPTGMELSDVEDIQEELDFYTLKVEAMEDLGVNANYMND